MDLTLDRYDLQEGLQINCSQTKYEHFKPAVQKAIKAVGSATYFTDRGTPNENYNRIYPPKK